VTQLVLMVVLVLGQATIAILDVPPTMCSRFGAGATYVNLSASLVLICDGICAASILICTASIAIVRKSEALFVASPSFVDSADGRVLSGQQTAWSI
jgi:hypothetical protein